MRRVLVRVEFESASDFSDDETWCEEQRRRAGSPSPASTIPGSPTPGSNIPGSPTLGSTIPGSPTLGSTIPGSPILGTGDPELDMLLKMWENSPLPSDFSPTTTASSSCVVIDPLHEESASRDRAVAVMQSSVEATIRFMLGCLQGCRCDGFVIEAQDIIQIPMSHTRDEFNILLENMCDMVNTERWEAHKFYIGIAVDPYERMTNSSYGHFSVNGWTRMRLLAAGDSNDVVRAERHLTDLFKDFPDCTNQRRGGGGRCPHGTAEFCYVVIRSDAAGDHNDISSLARI